MEKEVDGVLVAAHELKAPLAVLRQLALSFDEMDLKNEHIRSEMIKVSERAIRQVNDLTKLRRLEDGLFEMEPVAVREVCDAVTNELKYLFNSKKKKVSLKYSNRKRLVVANRELLYSVVYNFLLNAVHYSDDKSRVQVTIKDKKDGVMVLIRDYGPALSVEIWRKMRDGFIEQPTAMTMRGSSSGLGLFIASRFSKYMNAKVGAIRHHDGVSFYVELPESKQASLFL